MLRSVADDPVAPQRLLLTSLFAPRGVALIGVSDDPDKVTGRPLRNLLRGGYAGRVYPVNPNRQTVQGVPCHARLADIDGQVDHAYILLNSDAALEALGACAERGVKVATILADGFAEAGEAGRARQARLLDIVARTGIRVLGPNSMGAVEVGNGFVCTVNAAFRSISPRPGRYAVLSQSGSLMGALLSRGLARNMHFSAFASLGNEADLDIGEVGAALVDHDATDAFILFVETIRRPRQLARFAELARQRGKPVVAYKLGRSQFGRELAVSHTGALIGSDAAADAFFRHHGIFRVDHFEALLDLPPLALALAARPGRPRSAMIVTATGGGAALVADRLALRGVEIRGLAETARQRLRARGINPGNGTLVDVSLAGANHDSMKTALREAMADGGAGMVIAVLGSSAEAAPQETVGPVIEAVAEAGSDAAPVCVFLVPDAREAIERLGQAGIAVAHMPESCAEAVALALRGAAPVPAAAAAAPVAEITRAVAAAARPVLTEADCAPVLDALGIERPRSLVIAADCVDPDPGPLRFPLAAKLLSGDLPHKTEAGAVTLGIEDREALRAALASMRRAAGIFRRDAVIDGILLQEMVGGLAEVMVGLTRDPGVGPVVTLAAGGTLAGLGRDHAIRLAPVSPAGARAMIAEVAGLAAIGGYRNLPMGDLDALAAAIAAFSRLAAHGEIAEAEINPLVVCGKGQGVRAVDALIRKAG